MSILHHSDRGIPLVLIGIPLCATITVEASPADWEALYLVRTDGSVDYICLDDYESLNGVPNPNQEFPYYFDPESFKLVEERWNYEVSALRERQG